MLDIGKIFRKSFFGLRTHHKSLYPIFVAWFLGCLLIIALLVATNAFSLIKEYSVQKEIYFEQLEQNVSKSNNTAVALLFISDQVKDRQFRNYVVDSGVMAESFRTYFSQKTIFMHIYFWSLFLIVMFFGFAWSRYLLPSEKRAKKVGFWNFLLQYLVLSLCLLELGLFLPLLILGLLIGVVAYFGQLWLLVLLLPSFVVFIVFMCIRLALATSSLVIHRTGAFAAIKDSFFVSRNYFWTILFLSLIVGILCGTVNNIVSQTVVGLHVDLLMDSVWMFLLLNFVLALFVFAVQSVTSLFSMLFSYYTYLSLKKK